MGRTLRRQPHARTFFFALPAAAGAIAMSADSPASPAAAAPAAHHRGDRFQNNYLEFEPKGIGELLKWRIDAAREHLPRASPAAARVPADLAFIAANARAAIAMEPAVTWIGHATMLAQIGGHNILTDPVFSQRSSPLSFAGPKRHVAAGLTASELPHIDAVLISHNHYDHLDAASVDVLAVQPGGSPLFVVPLGIKTWLAARGVTRVVELDWWQSTKIGATEIFFVPSQHWSGRSLSDRMKTLWGGYAVFAPDFQLYFAGDTAYSKDFADIHAHFAARHGADRGFDLALIPIGAYEPRWFMSAQHANPAEAVQIHLDLLASRSIGIHWGTFQLTDEALDEPPRALAAAARERRLDGDAFTVMAVGETRRFARRAP
jgi:N-acyl-phosphatidylethanolamine-hydrolysing phospholipase D